MSLDYVFGEDKINQFNIQVGEELTVHFDIDAREWQGRWFNSIRAWKVDATIIPISAPTPQIKIGSITAEKRAINWSTLSA